MRKICFCFKTQTHKKAPAVKAELAASMQAPSKAAMKADTHAISAGTEVPLNSQGTTAEAEELEKYNGGNRSTATEASNCRRGVSTLPRQNRKVSTPAMAMVNFSGTQTLDYIIGTGVSTLPRKIGRSVHLGSGGIFSNRVALAVMLWITASFAAILPVSAGSAVAKQGAALENIVEEVDDLWWAALCSYLLVVHLLACCTLARWSCSACRWTCQAASHPTLEAGMPPATSADDGCMFLLRRYTVVQLKNELRSRSMPVTGLKDDLITRLRCSVPFASGKQLVLIGRLLQEDSRLAATLALSDLTTTSNASAWIGAALKIKKG